jgi:hypothetical protein
MQKTGSTAFQRFCYHHGDELRAAGLAFPQLPFANHSSFLEAQFCADPERTRAKLDARGDAVLIDRQRPMRRAFLEDLALIADQGLDVIVSGEAASQFNAGQVAAARDVLATSFDRMVVLGLARPPLSFARSVTQQAVRTGRTLDQLLRNPPVPEYRRRFGPYFDVLPASAVRLRLFRSDQLVEGCVLQTLLAMTDGDRSALSDARAERVNESLSLTAAKFVSLIQQSLAARALAREIPEPVRRALGEGFCGDFFAAVSRGEVPPKQLPLAIRREIQATPGTPFLLPREVAGTVENLSAEDDAWLSQRLGLDVRDYDTAFSQTSDSIGFADFHRFDDEEVAAMIRSVEAINTAAAEAGETVDDVVSRLSWTRRRKTARYVRSLAPRKKPPANKKGKGKGRVGPARALLGRLLPSRQHPSARSRKGGGRWRIIRPD